MQGSSGFINNKPYLTPGHMGADATRAASALLEEWCEAAGVSHVLHTAESLRTAMLKLPSTDATSTFLAMTEDEFAAIFNLMKERKKQEPYDFSYYDRLWPITDKFEALCLSQNIGVPSYQRIPRAMVIEAFNAIDPGTLSAEQATDWHYFKAMEQSEFNEMFNELYNPFRLSERQRH